MVVETFLMDENKVAGFGFGIFVSNSKYKPNKGVVTCKNIYCHKYVITAINNCGVIFTNILYQGISCPLLARQSINHSSLSIFILVAS